MNDTVNLAEAIACLCWAAIAAVILYRLRDRQIGALLRLSLGVIVPCGIILGATRIALFTPLDGISPEWMRFARIAGPIAATIVIWQMHRIMLQLQRRQRV